jgi:YD repeat-containing protein
VDGMSLKYEYDTLGKVTKIYDPANGLTETKYDDVGRKTSHADQNSGTTSYTYDKLGNIETQTDAKSLTTTFIYDNLNCPTSVSYSNGEGNTTLKYDEGGVAKFALGRLTSVVDAAGKLVLGYDIRGNRIYQKRSIDNLHVIFKRSYDIQNRLASTTYPDGTVVHQQYASMNDYGLAIKKKKRSVKMTNSRHKFPIYKNEIKDLPNNFPGFIIVSDITYINAAEGNLYLSLLTERNTKKILGYNVGASLIVEESIKALENALKMLPKTHQEVVYHHSDRGSQYSVMTT